ncbi:MAG: MFS transporter, partial [Jatrophihabitantaceae bacterium]
AAAVLVLGVRHMPETRSSHSPPRLDVVGTLLIAASLAALTFGTSRAGTSGWSGLALGTTVAGVLVGLVFVLVERIKPDPLVPLGLFSYRTFVGTNVMTLLTYAALSAFLFLFVLNLQVSAGYGAFAAGPATLPLTFFMLLLSARSGALAARIGPRLQLTVGPLLAAAGLLLTLRIDEHHHNYLLDVLPGVIVFALGMTTLVAPLTASVMSSAPSDDVGVASGVNNAISRAGGLLAVAVLPPLAGLHGEAYRHVAVMVHGYRVVTLCCVGLLVLAAVVILLTVSPSKSEG